MSENPARNMTRRGLLTALLATAATPVLAGAPQVSVRPPIKRGPFAPPAVGGLVRSARLNGDVGFVVVDAGTGTVLEAMNADAGIAPASTAKAITALYALDTLGSSHRFNTRVIVTGGVKEGVVQGDMILAGGCDPTTDTRDFAALAAQMKEAGIIAVKGAFYVYEGPIASIRSIDPEQPDHLGYSPAVAGIALNFNRVHFEWTRSGESYKVSMDARAGRYRPEVEIARMQVERRRAPIYTYEDANGRDNWTVARSALGREGARWLPVRRPGLYAGEVFSTLARSHGVVLGSPKLISTLPQGQTVAEVLSDPLSDVVQGMLKYSNNMTAEMIGMAATHARLGGVPSLSASAAEMNTWAVEVLGMRTPAFADHSGLGSASRVTAADMAKGLAAAGRAEALRPLMKPVKLLDSKGRVTNTHPVKADAKTGTLNFVSGLAGYITAPGGRDMAFAIFAADEDKRATITREMRERPPGGRSYATRARKLQRQLIMRWGSTFDEAQG